MNIQKKEYKLIFAHIFEPKNSLFKALRNDKAECQTIRCKNSKACGLYKRGECSYISGLGWHRCPYGKYSIETGFTPRAMKYLDWVRERKERYKDVLDSLKSHSEMLAEVGDYIFLPYSHMAMNEKIPFLSHDNIVQKGAAFLPKEAFITKNIANMCLFHPQAFLGGEIRTYQNEQVPKFIKHLKELMPDIYNKLKEKHPFVKDIAEVSNIGRKAILQTLVPNQGKFVDIHKGEWLWDGTYLTSYNSKASFMLTSKFSEIKIKPEENCEVTITADEQISKDTKFTS